MREDITFVDGTAKRMKPTKEPMNCQSSGGRIRYLQTEPTTLAANCPARSWTGSEKIDIAQTMMSKETMP